MPAPRGEYEKGVTRIIEGAEGLVDFDLLTVEEMNNAPFPYYDEVIAHRYFDFQSEGTAGAACAGLEQPRLPLQMHLLRLARHHDGQRPPTAPEAHRAPLQPPTTWRRSSPSCCRNITTRSIYFDDDTFNLGDKHVERMCAVMRKIGGAVGGDVPSRYFAHGVVARDEGERLLSASRSASRAENQHVRGQYRSTSGSISNMPGEPFAECQRVGMTVHGTFTYGLPGETTEQMMDTKRYRDFAQPRYLPGIGLRGDRGYAAAQPGHAKTRSQNIRAPR